MALIKGDHTEEAPGLGGASTGATNSPTGVEGGGEEGGATDSGIQDVTGSNAGRLGAEVGGVSTLA